MDNTAVAKVSTKNEAYPANEVKSQIIFSKLEIVPCGFLQEIFR
jgi:hypothetical protein